MLALRLANADVLPLDAMRYAAAIGEFLNDAASRAGVPFERASAALKSFETAAGAQAAASDAALARGDEPALAMANRDLSRVETAFIDRDGLPGRPWYRHVIYAPAYSYRPEVLPGLSEALEARVPTRLAEEERRLAEALARAAQTLAPRDAEGLVPNQLASAP